MADMSFDEVVRELGVSAEELKRMIADNEIRAFHAGGQLKFKREDVTKLKDRLETAPTIVLSDTEADSILEEPTLEEPALPEAEEALASDETVLSVDGLLEDDAPTLEEPTADLSAGASDEILLESEPVPAAASRVGEDTVLDSGILGEEDLSLGIEDTQEEGMLEEERAAPRRVRARAQEAHPVMTATLVVTAVLLILPGAILVNLSGGENGVFPQWIQENLTLLNGLIDGIVGLF